MDIKKRKRCVSSTEGVAKKSKDLQSQSSSTSYNRGQLGRDELKEAIRHGAALKTVEAQLNLDLQRFMNDDNERIANFTLPFSTYSIFESATSEEDNYGVDKDEMINLWIYVMEHLCTYLSSSTRPSVLLYHEILHKGIKDHSNQIVRSHCLEFMHALVQECYPPMDEMSRTYYIYAFSPKLIKQSDKNYDPNSGWMHLSQCLVQLIDGDKSACLQDYLTFLLDLLETDGKLWKHEVVINGFFKSSSLLQSLLWNESGGVCFNYRLRELNTYLVQAMMGQRNSYCLSLLRRLTALVCDIIDLSERGNGQNEVKLRMVHHLTELLSSQCNAMKEKDLMCQIFLLEPDWLASQVSQQLLGCQSKETHGLRGLMNTMSKIQIQEKLCQTEADDEEESKENSMVDVNENSNHHRQQRKQGKALPPRNQYGETTFHVASRQGNLGKLLRAFQKYPDPSHLQLEDHNGWTALHEACHHGHIEIVKELLLHIKTPQILLCKGGEDQVTALHEALASGKQEIVDMLLEHHRKIGGLNEALKDLPDQAKSPMVCQGDKTLISKHHILASMSIYKYILSYGLVEVREILKSKAVDKKGKHLHPLNRSLRLEPMYQHFLRSKFCVFPMQRSDIIKAEDVRTYWKEVGKKIICTLVSIEDKKYLK